ncbi:MAG: cysteine dioxygenase family protein [Microcoleaceae cyanobacterium]
MSLSQISSICSLEQFIQKLNIYSQKDASYYDRLIQTIDISPESIASYCRWDSQSYTRNLVCQTDIYQLLVLCWQAGQASPVHDHQGQDCWMYIVEGTIQETLYHPTNNLDKSCILQETDRIIHKRGDTSRLENSTLAWHSIQALSQRVITLHLYSQPINKCHIYDIKTGQVSERKLNYS